MESMQPHVTTRAWSKLTRGTKRGAGQYIRHIFSEIDNDIRGRFDIGFDRNLMDSGNWVYWNHPIKFWGTSNAKSHAASREWKHLGEQLLPIQQSLVIQPLNGFPKTTFQLLRTSTWGAGLVIY